MMGIPPHAIVAQDSNGPGKHRTVCRCGRHFYGQTPEQARDRLSVHIYEMDPQRYERSR